MQHLDEGTLQAWLDGARSGLDPSKLAKIERHLTECDSCASRVDALARSSFRAHALLSVGRDRYAPRLSYEDLARRARGTRTSERSVRRKVSAAWAASIVGAIGIGWISNEIYHASGSADVETAEVVSAPATPPPPAVLAQTPLPEITLPTAASSAAGGSSPTGISTQSPATLVAAADAPTQWAPDLLVHGLVEDEGGRPVPSAQVYVADLDVGVLTQPDGRYDLRLPAEPGSFEVTVERIGFRQQTREISGREGDYVAADFRLREEALTLDEIVVTGESDGGQRRTMGNTISRRATPFVWRPLPSIAAEGYVGSDLWTLPELDLLTLEVAYGDNPNETHVARVRQVLGDGTTVTLVQGRTDGRRTRWPIQSAGAVLSTWRGEMLITATAPVSADSLRTLLSQLR
jgi:anti-sigma factor RsiW